MYEGLNEYQRINHFPLSSEITRKDRLSDNINLSRLKYSESEFNFFPETFVLPDGYDEFFEYYQQLVLSSNKLPIWIIKPCNLSRGRGIYITDKINEIPTDEYCIISRYITNPLLINGLKFDLRIYVVISCLDPLRIYIYNEGLTRFATESYDINNNHFSRYAHLTNYSVNKNNSKFIHNSNINDDSGENEIHRINIENI